jgi:hypothetical protein
MVSNNLEVDGLKVVLVNQSLLLGLEGTCGTRDTISLVIPRIGDNRPNQRLGVGLGENHTQIHR